MAVLVRGLWQQRCILMLKKKKHRRELSIQWNINIEVLVSWFMMVYEVGSNLSFISQDSFIILEQTTSVRLVISSPHNLNSAPFVALKDFSIQVLLF